MPGMGRQLPRALVWGVVVAGVLTSGCTTHKHLHHNAPPPVPHELARAALPPYVIESPDVLLIDAIRLVPKPPYKVEPFDSLGIRVTETLPEQPIQGVYSVEADGTVNLGFNYGSPRVAGLTLEQAREAIEKHLQRSLKPGFRVEVAVAESRALQLIRGPHLVQTDGTVNLGLYGSVFVDNMSIPQAKATIEAHLSQFLVNPEISLSVSGFNSKVFFIVFEGAGVTGDQIIRLPMQAKTTVLDALGQLNGLPFQVSSKRIQVVRPAPSSACGSELVLPVNYKDIVLCGKTETNYQLYPGDRLVVRAAPLVRLDAIIARITAPYERLLGTALLTNSVISSIQSIQVGPQGGGGGTGLFFGVP